jgi:hypothetical protein
MSDVDPGILEISAQCSYEVERWSYPEKDRPRKWEDLEEVSPEKQFHRDLAAYLLVQGLGDDEAFDLLCGNEEPTNRQELALLELNKSVFYICCTTVWEVGQSLLKNTSTVQGFHEAFERLASSKA